MLSLQHITAHWIMANVLIRSTPFSFLIDTVHRQVQQTLSPNLSCLDISTINFESRDSCQSLTNQQCLFAV